MAWNAIPNELVKDFRGVALKHVRLDNDGEVVYKPFRCPAEACSERFTAITDYKEHWTAEHTDQEEPNLSVTGERDESRAADVILELLMSLNARVRNNPLAAVQKTNDPHHATETWRRVRLAVERNGEIRLKTEQYDWLKGVLARKLPLSKTDRDDGQEQQTVAAFMWALSADNVEQTLRIPSERRVREGDEDEAA